MSKNFEDKQLEKLEKLDRLKERGVISEDKYEERKQVIESAIIRRDIEPSQRFGKIVVFVFGVGLLLVALNIGNSTPNNKSEVDQSSTQKQNSENKLAKREDVVNRLSPQYCASHQDARITGSGSAELPANNGNGWSADECRAIVGTLYDIDENEINVQNVINKKIWIGMSVIHLGYSLGDPQDINSTVTSLGESQQWVYPGYNYVYVENGKVTSYQI